MNLRQIEAFRAVMITGSGTDAAKMLFISQPAISRLISDLEYHSNLTLFIRKPNRLVPTAEAHALYREVDRAFIGLDEIKRCAENLSTRTHGNLRIVAMPICVESFLPSVIADFSKQYPAVNIELETAPHLQAIELVRSRRLDLGIIAIAKRDEHDLNYQTLCQRRAVCVFPNNHPLVKKTKIEAQDLANIPFISLSQGSPFRTQLDELFDREKVVRDIVIETRTQRTIYDLIEAGAGVSILDPMIIPSQNDQIVTRPFSPEMSWDYAMIEPQVASISLITQSFKALLLERFSTNMPSNQTP